MRAEHIGTETAFSVLARAAAMAAEGRDIINLGIGQPDFPTPEHIVEAAVKALRDGAHGYTPAGGIPPLREAVAADLNARYGLGRDGGGREGPGDDRLGGDAISPRHVQILPGGKVVIFFAAMLLGAEGGEIIYPDPGFPIYASAVGFSGATPRPYPLSEEADFAFSADDVLGRITPRTRLIIINSPANPTGGVTPRAEIEKLVAGLAAHPHVMLMSDEIYDRLVFDGNGQGEGHGQDESGGHGSGSGPGSGMTSLLQFPEIRERLIILNGWSKTYAMTGWRLGYAIWPEMMLEAAERLAVNIHSCVNAAAQAAGLAALTGPQDCVETMRGAFMRRARLITDGLNALPGFTCREPAGAFYAFPNITGVGDIVGVGVTSDEMQEGLLEEAGVALISGTSFGACGEGYLRFSCASSDEEIAEALGRIKEWLGQRG